MKNKMLSPLPELMIFDDGSKATKENWNKRKKELSKYAVDMLFGSLPPKPEVFSLKINNRSDRGKLCTYKIVTGTKKETLTVYLRVYTPKGDEKCPVVLTGDGCWKYFTSDVIDMLNSNGFAVAIFDRTELARDIFHDPKPRDSEIYRVYPDIKSGTIACWAWGIHRCIDALEQIDYIDTSDIAVIGHSRGGKAALLAAATDERIKYVAANGSGCAGAGCLRFLTLSPEAWEEPARERSERLEDLFSNFPNWLGEDMKAYIGREGELPFDMHYLKALIAPRMLIQTEGISDTWANSRGTLLTHKAAKEAYKLLGAEDNILIHYRKGGHSLMPEDIALQLNAIMHSMKNTPLSDEFASNPFENESIC